MCLYFIRLNLTKAALQQEEKALHCFRRYGDPLCVRKCHSGWLLCEILMSVKRPVLGHLCCHNALRKY